MTPACRLVSRWRHLPCPSSLSWLVENRLMERVAGRLGERFGRLGAFTLDLVKPSGGARGTRD
jgi:hypothetical protein